MRGLLNSVLDLS